MIVESQTREEEREDFTLDFNEGTIGMSTFRRSMSFDTSFTRIFDSIYQHHFESLIVVEKVKWSGGDQPPEDSL